jgi:hypothetical protein
MLVCASVDAERQQSPKGPSRETKIGPRFYQSNGMLRLSVCVADFLENDPIR